MLNRIEAAQIERVGRSIVSTLYRTPVLVLITTGRHTAQERRTPLAYLAEPANGTGMGDADLIIVGGAAGQRRTPDWVANLRRRPNAEVVVGRERVPVQAIEVSGAARDALWPTLVARSPRIARYEELAGRTVPVFRLRRL